MSIIRKTSTGFAKTIFKVTIYVVLALVLFYGCSYAYEYGQKVFEAKGVDDEPGEDITITIKNGTTVKQLGGILEDYGIIEDDFIFYLQTKVFEYKTVIPGTYVLNTSYSGEKIIAVLSEGSTSDEEGEGETDNGNKSDEEETKENG